MWGTDHQAEMWDTVCVRSCSSSSRAPPLRYKLQLSTAVSCCAPCRSLLSFHSNTNPFMDFCPLLSIPSFCLWALENLVFPPSWNCQVLVTLHHNTSALPWSNNSYFPNSFLFFFSFQIGKPYNKFILQVYFLLSLASAFPFQWSLPGYSMLSLS